MVKSATSAAIEMTACQFRKKTRQFLLLMSKVILTHKLWVMQNGDKIFVCVRGRYMYAVLSKVDRAYYNVR